MKLTLNGHTAFASTGGRDFDPTGDVVMFLHGSGQNHLGYMLQHRYLANRGFQCLTPDLPGHGPSEGAPLDSIEAQAAWFADFAKAAGVQKAHIVGHSQGGLMALELARSHASLLRSITFIATAQAIPVNDMLLDMARDDQPKAIAAMMDWGHGPTAHRHDHTMPGTSHKLYGTQLMASNAPGALFADLTACARYTGGPEAAETITCPTLTILAGQDKMTPIKQGRKLAAALPLNTAHEVPQGGHMLITEQPFAVNAALKPFLAAQSASV